MSLAIDEPASDVPTSPSWWRVPGPTRTFGVTGLLLVAVYLIFVLVDARPVGNIRTGDTDNLVAGARVAIDCVGAGDFVGCGWLEGSVQTAVFPYPLLQYVPAAAMVWFQVDDAQALTGMSVLSFIAVVSMLAVTVLVFRRRPRSGLVAVAALVGSSLMYQATSSFGEALAAAMVVAAVAAAIERRPVLLFFAALLACLGKETLGPFVLVLVLVCARSAHDRWFPRRSLTTAAVGAVVLGMLISTAFNVFRYAGVRNRLYLDPRLHTEGTVRKIEYFGALWVSPAAGIVWFWPVLFALGVLAVAWTIRSMRAGVAAVREWLPPLVVIVLTVGFVAGLTFWFSPFGWITFGPRLAVPILPAALIALLHTTGDAMIEWIVGGRVRAALIATSATIVSIPQYGAPWRWFDAVLQLISPAGSCPPMTEFDIYGDPDTYYDCTSSTMWRTRPQVLDDTVSLGLSTGRLSWMLAAAGCFMLVFAAVRPAPERGSTSAPDDVGIANTLVS